MITEVSAGGVVFRCDDVLVLRKQTGEWVMPKGHLEPGETPEEAAIREVLEETGLEARIIGRIGQTQYQFCTAAGELRRKVVHWYLMCVNHEAENIRVEPIFSEGRFMSVDTALSMLTFDNDRGMVRQAVEQCAQPVEGNPDKPN